MEGLYNFITSRVGQAGRILLRVLTGFVYVMCAMAQYMVGSLDTKRFLTVLYSPQRKRRTGGSMKQGSPHSKAEWDCPTINARYPLST
jgi:hypothetical protein